MLLISLQNLTVIGTYYNKYFRIAKLKLYNKKQLA